MSETQLKPIYKISNQVDGILKGKIIYIVLVVLFSIFTILQMIGFGLNMSEYNGIKIMQDEA
jgi:hypothetical protein